MVAELPAQVHATCIARQIGGLWRAALLLGASGAGKSDLALRALNHGWRLVSDDYTCVWRSGEALYASAPRTIAGRIEARGLGILDLPRRDLAEVWVAANCETTPLERLPEPETMQIAGLELALVRLNALESSALFKLDRALSTRGQAQRLERGRDGPI